MIVFTSDHGMAFAGGKTTVYEGGLKVPFVVRNPYEKKRGIRHTALISHIDITPSLLDFAGALNVEKNRPIQWKTQANHTQFPSPALQKTTVESPANYPVIMENHGFPFWGNQRRSIGAVFSLPILFTRFRCITPCGFTETRNSNLSGISLTHCLILLPRIYGQRVVFRLNSFARAKISRESSIGTTSSASP